MELKQKGDIKMELTATDAKFLTVIGKKHTDKNGEPFIGFYTKTERYPRGITVKFSKSCARPNEVGIFSIKTDANSMYTFDKEEWPYIRITKVYGIKPLHKESKENEEDAQTDI